jgi:hypothetical protein
MSKKKINIILIPSAIVIWVVVLLKVLTFTGPTGDSLSGKSVLPEKQDDKSSSDTLGLLLNYRDPFVAGSSPFIIKKTDDKDTEIFHKPQVVTPPSVTYHGLIDPGKNRNGVALADINNRSFLVSKGDTLAGLKIVNIFRDSLVFEFQKNLFTIKNTQQKKI